MNIEICSRRTAEKLLQGDFPAHTAVISFYDPGGKPQVNYSSATNHVIHIALGDFQTEIPEVDRLAEFIYKAKAEGLNILCQCELGHSRSAGCAAAILEHFYGRGNTLLDDDRYYPDQMVYDSVLEALETIKSSKETKKS